MQLNMEVELCDCDVEDLGLDLNHFEYLCKKHRPSVVVIVHVLGHPNKIDEIRALCEKYSVVLVEDACEALGSCYRGKYVGTFGKASAFSFYYSHQLSTIEGGMISVNDRSIYNIILSLRSHGWSRDVEAEYRASWEAKSNIDEVRSLYTFYYPGFNFRPMDLNAFIGLSQLDKAPAMVAKRQSNFNAYKKKLGNDFWVQTSRYDSLSSFGFGTLVKNRVEVFRHLKRKGIETRPLVCGNIGRQPFWIQKFGEVRLKNADIVHDHGLYLPNHGHLTEEQLSYVVSEFKKVAVPVLPPNDESERWIT